MAKLKCPKNREPTNCLSSAIDKLHPLGQTWHRSSRKMPLLPRQASSEQEDGQSRPQVSRQMLPIHCHAYLLIVTLECTSPAKGFPPKNFNEKKFLPTQSLIFILNENQSDDSMACKNPESFSSHPFSILRFEECGSAAIISAILALFLTNFFNKIF